MTTCSSDLGAGLHLSSFSLCSSEVISNMSSKITKSPALRAAKAEFLSYITDKSRYVSTTDQQGPLRHGEARLLARRRWYINQTMQWDVEGLCWRNKDGRPLIIKDLIWDTVISEMRQLHTHGQRLVWTTVKAKYDGILEDDVRMICKVWYKHGLSRLDRRNESQWTLYGDESSQDDEPPADNESVEVNKHLQDDASSRVNDHPQDDESVEINKPLQDDESSEANESSQGEASLQDEGPGRQFFKCVLIPQKHPIIDKNPPKRLRANSTEMLQRYTKTLEEKEEERPSRRAKKDIDRLRGIGAGIYASNAKPFAQEAAERMARTRTLAEFVDDAFPVAPKGRQGTAPTKRSRPRSPSYTPTDDDSDDDDSSDNDDDNGD